jgi:LPXTG-motif cell wall-anchored protein
MEKVVDKGRQWRTLAGLISMLVGAACLVASIPGQAGAQPGGPPGNNGTVKVDGVEFDDHPDNEPHVGCVFQVDFYGYDEGELFADVTFKVHPPTGNEVILEDTDIFIGEDDNSGGGSEAGLDASRTYDLTSLLAAFEPHPEQGWHVKLTVNADGSQGADVKHKVFWVSGCEAPPTTSTTSSTTSTTEKPTTTSSSTTSTTEKPTTTSSSTTSTTEKPTTTSSSTTTSSVVPASSTETTTTSVMPSTTTSIARVVGGRLPETGSDNDGLLKVAGLALLLGGAALFASTKLARRPLS